MQFNTQTIRRAKKKIIKPAKEELEKVRDTAKEQITGSKTPKISPIVEAMQVAGKPIDPQEVERTRREMKKRTQILEEEIEKERRKRQEREKDWAENQPKEEVIAQPGEPLVVPASKPSRGMPPGTKTKTPEIRKSKR